jgi:hypothetical protein
MKVHEVFSVKCLELDEAERRILDESFRLILRMAIAVEKNEFYDAHAELAGVLMQVDDDQWLINGIESGLTRDELSQAWQRRLAERRERASQVEPPKDSELAAKDIVIALQSKPISGEQN